MARINKTNFVAVKRTAAAKGTRILISVQKTFDKAEKMDMLSINGQALRQALKNAGITQGTIGLSTGYTRGYASVAILNNRISRKAVKRIEKLGVKSYLYVVHDPKGKFVTMGDVSDKEKAADIITALQKKLDEVKAVVA